MNPGDAAANPLTSMQSKQHIKALEERLSKMESLLHTEQASPPDESGSGQASSAPDPPPVLAPTLQSSRPAPDSMDLHLDSGEPQPVSQGGRQVLTHPKRMDHQIGTTDDTFTAHPAVRGMLRFFDQLSNRIDSIGSGAPLESLRRMVGSPIVPQESEKLLIEGAIAAIFSEFPLLHVNSFLERLKSRPMPQKCDEPAWWCCLNVVIALALTLKSANRFYRQVAGYAWASFKNAYAVFPELVVQGDDLSAAQAALAMVLFMRASADTRMTAILLSSAVGISQTLGVHRQGRDPGDVEAAMRSRVFWTGYVLSTEMSLHCGLPSTTIDEDAELDLPGERSLGGGGGASTTSEQGVLSIFRARAELATIQSAVRRRLYAARSLRQADNQLVRTILELEEVLEAWRTKLPAALGSGLGGQPMTDTLELHVAMLYLAYHSCASMVYWAAFRHGAWRTEKVQQPGDSDEIVQQVQVTAWAAKCQAAARATLRLLRQLPELQFTTLW